MPRPPRHNPRRANSRKRNAIRRTVLAQEDQCWLCGRLVDKSLPYRDPDTGQVNPLYPTLDEIVPVADGGNPMDRDNIRLAHLTCNSSRGKGKPRTKQQGTREPLKTSRAW